MEAEKRLLPRLDTDIELSIRHAGTFEWSSLRNLSGSGVFVKTENPQPVDSVVFMKLRLPNDPEVMEIVGRVIWTKQGAAVAAGMGIEFTEISVRHQEKIAAFVEKRLREIREGN